MMVALLLYGYARGVYSSRRLSQACEERVDFMAVTGLNQPDFRTVAEFRRRHLAALSGSTTSILLNTPGESALIVTALEGNKMARAGRGGLALATAAIGSFVACLIATGTRRRQSLCRPPRYKTTSGRAGCCGRRCGRQPACRPRAPPW